MAYIVILLFKNFNEIYSQEKFIEPNNIENHIWFTSFSRSGIFWFQIK